MDNYGQVSCWGLNLKGQIGNGYALRSPRLLCRNFTSTARFWKQLHWDFKPRRRMSGPGIAGVERRRAVGTGRQALRNIGSCTDQPDLRVPL